MSIKPTSPPLSMQRPIVMIVDDSPVQTNIFKRLTHSLDATFVILNACSDALAFCEQHAVDILVTDYNLEDGNTGVDIVRKLVHTGQSTRCFFMSSESPLHIRAELGSLPHAGFLIKPLNFKKFGQFIGLQLEKIHPMSDR